MAGDSLQVLWSRPRQHRAPWRRGCCPSSSTPRP